MTAWSIVAAWVGLSVPISLLLGATLSRGGSHGLPTVLPARVAAAPARPIA